MYRALTAMAFAACLAAPALADEAPTRPIQGGAGGGGTTGGVMLLPEQQELAMDAEPEAFSPAAGAWGRGGATVIALAEVSDEWLERALTWAWAKRAPAR